MPHGLQLWIDDYVYFEITAWAHPEQFHVRQPRVSLRIERIAADDSRRLIASWQLDADHLDHAAETGQSVFGELSHRQRRRLLAAMQPLRIDANSTGWIAIDFRGPQTVL